VSFESSDGISPLAPDTAGALRRCGMIAVVLALDLSDGTSPPESEWELPFDPTGRWEGHVQALGSGSGIDGPILLTLSIGPTTMNGASVEGTYWEGMGNDPQPCAGPVLISLDTSASFARY
jgi:hypothetical protein